MDENNIDRGADFHGLIPGLILVGVGALFFLNNLGIFYIHDIFSYWPVLLVVWGIYKLIEPRSDSDRGSGAALIIGGGVWLAINLGYVHLSFGEMWPLILIGIGIWTLVNRMAWPPVARLGHFSQTTGAGFAETLNETAVFSGGKRHFTSENFQGGKVDAVFGGFEIDLRDAKMSGPSAKLELNAVFGGIELRVPREWLVVSKGAGVFGGFTDETYHPSPNQVPEPKRLVVKGAGVFGGVIIKN